MAKLCAFSRLLISPWVDVDMSIISMRGDHIVEFQCGVSQHQLINRLLAAN
jgi:hypothetical protein